MIAILVAFAALRGLYREMFNRPETRALMFLALVVVVMGISFYMVVERWTLLDAAYFCVVTLGTVGYGDITPTTPLGKVFTMIYIVVGLGIIGGFFGAVSNMVGSHALDAREKVMLKRGKQKGAQPENTEPDARAGGG